MKKYYITTPIYYVNGLPHIGHAYTSIIADVVARFMRLNNFDVKLLTGTDEHGQKVESSAVKINQATIEFVDEMSLNFRNLADNLNISYDDFIRTTEKRHIDSVHHFWQKLLDNKNIYLGKYEGWYSLRDESFFDESELTIDGKAPTGADVTWVSEDSYFFALSKWQDKLLELYENNPNFITPLSRRLEVINFVKSGLKDLSISRTSFSWGIRVPNNEKHVIYVWLDALVNYLSTIGYNNSQTNQMNYWPCDAHIVGKDILRFHAVYWPAFLMAAELDTPKKIVAHGWWLNNGQKMSKSIGNVIDPNLITEKFGVDHVRYFLMREINFNNDGNYSDENLINRINSELANKIGNLLQRTVSLIHKYYDGVVPEATQEQLDYIYSTSVITYAQKIVTENIDLVQEFALSQILNNIVTLAEHTNIYIDQDAPWSRVKISPKEALLTLMVVLESLRYIAITLIPFIPKSANLMLDQLTINPNQREFKYLNINHAFKAKTILPKPQIIFPRITIDI